MKFLLDENVHRGLSFFLIELKHDIKLSPKSIKNGKVMELALREERILVSRDADFIHKPLSSSKHFGIILLRVPPGNLEEQKKSFSKLLKQLSSSEEFRGKLIKISLNGEFEFL